MNKFETEILFKSLYEIFSEIFELEIDDRQVRRKFTLVSGKKGSKNNSSGDLIDNQGKTSY